MILFPYQGRIVKVEQLYYYTFDPNSIVSVPLVGKPITPYEDIGVGLLKDSSLMGNFSFLQPNFPSNVSQVNMISSSTMESSDP